MHRLITILAALALLLPDSGQAATSPPANPAENHAFEAAARLFNEGFFDRAETGWAAFIQQYPNSARLPQALLYQAQACFARGRFETAVQLLTAHLGRAGSLTDQYLYWLAEAQFQRADYPAAAAGYARLAHDFPDSPLRLKAAYGEATAWFRAGNLSRVVQLLRQSDGAFRQAARAHPDDEFVIRGYLLLAETLLRQNNFKDAETALTRLGSRRVPPELQWKRQYLEVQIRLGAGNLPAALQSATRLLTWTTSAGLRTFQGRTVALKADILQKLGQPAAAIAAYTNNLAADVPVDQRRHALVRIIGLYLGQNETQPALEWLQTFLTEHPKDPAQDLVYLTIGELRLKEYEQMLGRTQSTNAAPPTSAVTNLLAQAQTNFDQVIARFPQSPLLGKAYLDRGWCLWETGKYLESRDAFREAAARSPLSQDQAVARFKWADAQFRLGDDAAAITNYLAVPAYAKLVPALPSTFIEQALYQTVRAAIKAGNPTVATNALDRLLTQYPNSFFCDDCLLLVGQELNDQGDPAAARQVFADFLKRFPSSELVPEVKLAIARTYLRDNDLPSAIAQYDAWVRRYTNYPSWPQAEFDRAWLWNQYSTAHQSNAISLLTNFVARFPENTNAPLAQYLVAIDYFNQGDWLNAEASAKILFQNPKWPRTELTYQAIMMAGRAAFAREGYTEAGDYFKSIINDDHAPPGLVAQAFFCLGDTLTEEPPPNPAEPLRKFVDAINAFARIPATTHLAPRAWGRIGDCYRQLAAQDPARNGERAAEFYQKVITSTQADISTRSQAEFGLGQVLEKQAETQTRDQERLSAQALTHYLNILNGANLREHERADPYWFAQAGLAAARLLEQQRKWSEAIRVYEHLAHLPSLHATVEPKIKADRERLDSPRK